MTAAGGGAGAEPPGPGISSFDIDPTWAVGGKAHGGYLLRTAVEAALDADHPHPLAVSAHYLSSPDPGPAQLEVQRLRTGRRVATSRIALRQGRPAVEVLLTAGTLTDDPPHWSASDTAPPVLPPPPDCPRAPSQSPLGFTVGYFDHVDLRLDPATTRWAVGEPAGQARTAGWVRRDDGAGASPLDLLVFADASPPVTFDLGLFG